MAKAEKPQSNLEAETVETAVSAQPPPLDDSAMPIRLPEQIGKYHIKRVIAAGGMGVVYEALQEHPRRTVALKIMKQGIASRSALRRFEYESQILARLRHPGIAQVYEAGMHDDGTGGVPYFAMEYIAGAKDLVDYARSKALPIRERLALFDKVCDALHHGHQKGIIHRDLKPANILVDSSGQPKIIDFGVARATDSDLAVPTLQTDVGQLVGTVQYMSPEQIAADPHDIDTRSDVYALGVVLYKMLTDQLPYDVSGTVIYEATRMVREQPPRRLSAINRVLRGDIETIVMHALEKDRDRRYQSAIELAADIQRYLSNRPILARPPSVAYNFRTFVRRNKVVVTAMAGIFVALVLGIVGTSWKWKDAVRERDRGERMFGQVRQLAKTFMVDFHDSIQKLDGSIPARELLVKTALSYLGGIIDDAADKPDLMREIAAAYDRVGDIQGGFTNPSLGDTKGALVNYRRALEIRENLLVESPNDVDLLDGLAGTQVRIGSIFKNTNDLAGAAEAYRQAVAIREKQKPARLLVIAMNVLGDVQLDMGNLSEAEAIYTKAQRIAKDLEANPPPDDPKARPEIERDVTVGYGKIGDVLHEKGDDQGALLQYKEQVRRRQAIDEKDSTGRTRRDLAVAQYFVGLRYLDLEQPTEALGYFNSFLEVSRQKVLDNPDDWRSARDLLAAHIAVGRAHLALGDLAQARAQFDEASGVAANIKKEHLDLLPVREELASRAEARGDLAAASRNFADAASSYREGLTMVERMVTDDPINVLRRGDHAHLLRALGSALSQAGEKYEARLRLDEAQQLYSTLYREHPEYASLRKGLARTLREIASARRLDGDAAGADAADAEVALLEKKGG